MMVRATRRSLFVLPLASAVPVLFRWLPANSCPKPPRMELCVRRRRQRGRLGSYCWGDEDAGCCVDTGALYPFRPLYLYRGEVAELHFAALGPVAALTYWIRSARIVAVDDGLGWEDRIVPRSTRQIDLVYPASPVRLPGDLPHGLYLVEVVANPVGGGDTRQGFRLYVGPDSATRAPVATPLATPVGDGG